MPEALNQEQEAPEAAKVRPLSLLASETFGESFFGDVPEEPSEDAPETPEIEVSSDVQEEPEGEPTPEEETPSEVPIQTLQELIEHNEYDPEWVQSLKVPVKVNGQESAEPLAELVKSYQIRKATDAVLAEAKEKSKELDRQKSAFAESLQVTIAIREEESAALDELTKKTDWAKLRSDDPAEYSARKADIEDRRQKLEARKQKAVQSFQKAQQAHMEQVQNELRQRVQTESAQLLEKIPEWRDPEKAKVERTKLSEYLIGQGYTEEEIAQAYDHRLVVGLRKAMLWDEHQAKSDVAKKKVAKVPKVLKPGAPKPKEQISREKVDQARQRLRSSGKLDDAYALLKARRGN